jgi:hypothetical protein
MDLHLFQTYGLTGLLIGGVLLLIYRLIAAVSRSACRRAGASANDPDGRSAATVV